MRGPDRLLGGVMTLFRAPLWDLVGDCRCGLYAITHPEAGGVFLPAGPGDRWLYGTETGAEEPTAEAMARRIGIGAGVDDLRPAIERIGTFSFAAQVAERFRHGSAFLVGDAAHRVTPRGGTGMNTAIQDGYDLGWKLAWVLRGWAGADLLDSYETERRPVAEHNVARSADADGTTRAAEQELHVDLGGRIAHAWLPVAEERVSTLDLLGPGLTMLAGPEGTGWAEAAASVRGPMPLVVRSLDAITARALGVLRGGALLVRPDGVPAGWWPKRSDAVPALRAAVGALSG
jgi:hypothetical protein